MSASALATSAARVERAVTVAVRVADSGDPLGIEARRDLVATSGLSREGVELALTEHLETAVSDADLASLTASVDRAPRCHVVLAANVCTAALRAIALALAASPAVTIRPSRRDPGLAPILARELGLTITDAIAPEPGDALHVYGSDETIARIRASVDVDVIVRAHGTGLGIALVGAGVDLDRAAQALAADVVPFDQRGCLSPRFALVDGGEDRAESFAAALDAALLALGQRVPRGPLDDDARSAITWYGAGIDAIGARFAGPHHLVGLDPTPRALPLPPAARVVHVVPASAESARSLLAPWARFVTTIGASSADALLDVARAIAPKARCAPLGRMQRPPLDGPVDRRGLDEASG